MENKIQTRGIVRFCFYTCIAEKIKCLWYLDQNNLKPRINDQKERLGVTDYGTHPE